MPKIIGISSMWLFILLLLHFWKQWNNLKEECINNKSFDKAIVQISWKIESKRKFFLKWNKPEVSIENKKLKLTLGDHSGFEWQWRKGEEKQPHLQETNMKFMNVFWH